MHVILKHLFFKENYDTSSMLTFDSANDNCRSFLSSITAKTFTGLDCIYE